MNTAKGLSLHYQPTTAHLKREVIWVKRKGSLASLPPQVRVKSFKKIFLSSFLFLEKIEVLG
jgi:hypothetical protein